MRAKTITRAIVIFSMMMTLIISSGCKCKKGGCAASQTEVDSLRNQVKRMTAGNEMLAKNLATFDTLDYTVFSKQQWTRLHESHSKDIKVNWPDGHSTIGIEKHIADLSAMFVYA